MPSRGSIFVERETREKASAPHDPIPFAEELVEVIRLVGKLISICANFLIVGAFIQNPITPNSRELWIVLPRFRVLAQIADAVCVDFAMIVVRFLPRGAQDERR